MNVSMSRSNARRSASSVNSPSGSRDQIASNVAVDAHQAEEVVEPVVERVRIALDVEEQVARRGRREARQPALDVDRLARPAAGAARSVARAAALRAGSGPARARARGRSGRCPRSAASVGSASSPSASSVATPRSLERLALAGGDPGHEAEMVVRATSLHAFGRPAADVAMVDRLRIRPGRRDRRWRVVPDNGEESVLRAAGSRPCSRRRAGARPRGRSRRGRRAAIRVGPPGSARAGRCTSRSGGWRSP